MRREKVRAIRASHEANHVLASAYGIAKSTVWQIRKGLTWRTV